MDLIEERGDWAKSADAKVAQGICAQCNRPREINRRHCRYHLDLYNERSRLKGLSGAKSVTNKRWFRKRQAKALDKNLCRYCMSPRDEGFAICKGCRAKQRDWRRYRDYGLTPEQYESMLSSQDYGCAICGTRSTGVKERGKKERAFMIDHDHETGIVRGLLCHHCNLGIGHFRDNQALLAKAISYLGRALQST